MVASVQCRGQTQEGIQLEVPQRTGGDGWGEAGASWMGKRWILQVWEELKRRHPQIVETCAFSEQGSGGCRCLGE